MITLLKTIISNIRSPKYRFIYTRKDGTTDMYIIQNPIRFKGSKKTTFSNDVSRKFNDYNIGFRAKCLSRDGQVRSFYYAQIRELHRLPLTEEVSI